MNKIRGHQGDVQFTTIEKLPNGCEEVRNKPLALGEVHGHAHVLTGDVKRFEKKDNGLIRVFYQVYSGGAVLQHTNISLMTSEEKYKTTEVLPVADHKPHILEPGIYEFCIQNEYNPYSKLMEKVID